MDERILEALRSCGLVLSPAIIAYNIDKSREAVTRRLSDLTEYGLTERVERGKYKITEEGKEYLSGDLDPNNLDDQTD